MFSSPASLYDQVSGSSTYLVYRPVHTFNFISCVLALPANLYVQLPADLRIQFTGQFIYSAYLVRHSVQRSGLIDRGILT